MDQLYSVQVIAASGLKYWVNLNYEPKRSKGVQIPWTAVCLSLGVLYIAWSGL